MSKDQLRQIGRVLTVTFLLLGAIAFTQANSGQSADSADAVYDPGKNGVTVPKAIYHPDAEYSEKSRKKKVSGAVVISMIVTPDGTVRDPKVVTSLNKDLDKQALAAVSTWKFEPATKDGKPVAVRLSVEVDFRLY